MIEGVIKEGHGRYLIPSESEPGSKRLVDLFPKPKCSCPGFGIYVEARGQLKECRHVSIAYEAFGREIADQIRAQVKKNSNPFAPE
jgi:hypothetical protein